MLGEVLECYMEKCLIARRGFREESECWEKSLNADKRPRELCESLEKCLMLGDDV